MILFTSNFEQCYLQNHTWALNHMTRGATSNTCLGDNRILIYDRFPLPICQFVCFFFVFTATLTGTTSNYSFAAFVELFRETNHLSHTLQPRWKSGPVINGLASFRVYCEKNGSWNLKPQIRYQIRFPRVFVECFFCHQNENIKYFIHLHSIFVKSIQKTFQSVELFLVH